MAMHLRDTDIFSGTRPRTIRNTFHTPFWETTFHEHKFCLSKKAVFLAKNWQLEKHFQKQKGDNRLIFNGLWHVFVVHPEGFEPPHLSA